MDAIYATHGMGWDGWENEMNAWDAISGKDVMGVWDGWVVYIGCDRLMDCVGWIDGMERIF
jgi:hypothetical protein